MIDAVEERGRETEIEGNGQREVERGDCKFKR